MSEAKDSTNVRDQSVIQTVFYVFVALIAIAACLIFVNCCISFIYNAFNAMLPYHATARVFPMEYVGDENQSETGSTNQTELGMEIHPSAGGRIGYNNDAGLDDVTVEPRSRRLDKSGRSLDSLGQEDAIGETADSIVPVQMPESVDPIAEMNPKKSFKWFPSLKSKNQTLSV